MLQDERDGGTAPGLKTGERERLKQLERENFELKRANEILRKASALFRTGGARPPTEVMVAFIDDYRWEYGVEPICEVLPIAPSTYYEHRSRKLDPTRRPHREKRDETLRVEVQSVFAENFSVYGAEKIWRQLRREKICIARCTVERLMREDGLHGVVRGRAYKITTHRCSRVTVPRAFHPQV